ncbi:hypothetical protein [Caulobacter sp. 17J65-9]|uniref:hypothetical protein n=1 Tax=Caulobacter sp. 17J65-9 TaxID=2709382 RepID=UPI0013C88EFC|nr:hypothetical protein [Caulobacter sp. 17J65-9]NEX91545.1 hypothetical protein [Caulobacter sp. 17J65-9]
MGGVTVRRWAEFASDLPEDQIEDEHDIVQYGGKSVAEAIHAVLEGLGCAMEPVTYAHEHGWEFCFSYEKRYLWCQVTLIEEYLVVVDDRTFFGKALGYHPAYQEIMTKLARALAEHPRFSNVRWYFDHQVHSGEPGAKEPVTAA